MTPGPGHPLDAFVSQARGPALVLHDASTGPLLGGLASDTSVEPIGGQVPGAPRRWPAVALVVADAVALRQSVSVLPNLGRSRLIAWWLVEADEPALVVPRPEWPTVVDLDAQSLEHGGVLTTLRAEGPVGVNAVLGQVARTLTRARAGQRGVVVATTSSDPATAPAADPGLIMAGTVLEAAAADRPVPPDVVLSGGDRPDPLPPHDIIARPPTVVSEPDLLAGPLDEGMLNPKGFLRHPGQGAVPLVVDAHRRLRLAGEGLDLPLERGVTPATVASLRDHDGVRLTWPDQVSPSLIRAVAALAMAGVPLTGPPPPRSAVTGPGPAVGPRLGPRLAEALAGRADLGQPLAREEHSVRLRRAALLEHSTLAWRERLATEAGLAFRRFPTCSLVLCTSRPHRLAPALRQLHRQSGADVELVVVTQGFSADKLSIEERSPHPVTVVDVPSSAGPGEALDAGVAAASGDLVVTMDDDAWYGADSVSDLLLARHYSGAALVDMPSEFAYVEESARTVRRAGECELTVATVVGSTMLIGRRYLRELGGFRRPGRGAATTLAAAVRLAGDTVYRTHGLGRLGRHSSELDTDHPGEYWWDGFRPSRLLEPAV